MTFKQIKSLDGAVNKGEKSERVFFFTAYDKEKIAEKDFTSGNRKINKGDTYETTILCPKFYPVFNLSQTTLADVQTDVVLNEDFQSVLDYHNPEIITHDKGEACYVPSLDIIRMPSLKYFESEESYQAILCHELAHWTMHEKRLNRAVDFSCKLSYAKEELIAELSSAMLSAHFGIKTDLENHASYIDSWLKNLTDEDFNLAVKQSVKVLSYLLNCKSESLQNESVKVA